VAYMPLLNITHSHTVDRADGMLVFEGPALYQLYKHIVD